MTETFNLNLNQRWIPTHLTTSSGKIMYLCACCGRLSATPDKKCNDKIQHRGEGIYPFCHVWPNHENHSYVKHILREQIHETLNQLNVKGDDVLLDETKQGNCAPRKGSPAINPLNLKEYLEHTDLEESNIPDAEVIDLYDYDATCTANDPVGRFESILLYAVGLSGEAGELLEKVKKIWTQKNKEIEHKDVEDIVHELGDISWYLFQLARVLEAPMREVLQQNINKRHSRNKRGKLLQGEGDYR